jgi:hypothetical protein
MIIENVNVEVYEKIYAAAWYGDRVEMYIKESTIIKKTKSRDTAKKIFKKIGVEWEYGD